MQVFLIRHPRPLVDAGICYGQLDVAAEDPQLHASRLNSILPAHVKVISSPLQRARRLAEALHTQPPCQPKVDVRLMEISFGEWEGQRWEDIGRTLLDAWAADVLHFTPPGGESAAMLQARAVECAESLSGEAVALVTHSGVMRALLGYWLKLPVGEWSQLKFEFGHTTLIELNSGKATLRYMNR